jgi:hypothetical protein
VSTAATDLLFGFGAIVFFIGVLMMFAAIYLVRQ